MVYESEMHTCMYYMNDVNVVLSRRVRYVRILCIVQ